MFTIIRNLTKERRINAVVKAYKKLLKATTKLPDYQWSFNICISSDDSLVGEREYILNKMLSGNEKYGFRDYR